MGSLEVRADDDDGRTMHGYAAMFDQPTEINSWEGNFVEKISRGAFRKSLQILEPKIMFNHGMDPQIGDKPLGKASILREDKTGLYVEVPLDDTSYNRDLIPLLRSGALDGMSFRFSVIRDEWSEPSAKGGLPIRTLKEVKLMELGPVTFPAYAATSAGVRSMGAFSQWASATEEQRAAIAHILGTSSDVGGSDAEDAASITDIAQESVAADHHPSRTRYLQWKARTLS
jgi:HK97 family phage prohead protease